MPSNSCYLSLNFVNDPIYAFEKHVKDEEELGE